MLRQIISAVILASAGIAAFAEARAQEYPNHEIRVVLGYPAGSGADAYVRYFANKLSQRAKVPVLVENRPGAASSIATEFVARSKPDGYTVYLSGADSFAALPYIFKKPAVDPRKDFTYLTPLVGQGFILVVPKDRPYNNVAELTAHLKQKGDKGSYPTATNPSTIMSEIYKQSAGLNTLQVGYKTSADTLNDMMSGALDFMWSEPVFALARIREGKFKPLAVSTGKRISSIPDIPTARESGIDIDMNMWWIAAVPAGTPQSIVEKLNTWFKEIGAEPETKEFLGKFGAEPWTASPSETRELIDKELSNWERYVKIGKIEAQ